MSETPPRQLPTVREGTTFGMRFSVATWATIAGAASTALVGFATVVIFSYVMWSDVQSLKESQKKAEATAAEQAAYLQAMKEQQSASLQVIKDTLREIEWRQKYGATTALPGTSTNQP